MDAKPSFHLSREVQTLTNAVVVYNDKGIMPLQKVVVERVGSEYDSLDESDEDDFILHKNLIDKEKQYDASGESSDNENDIYARFVERLNRVHSITVFDLEKARYQRIRPIHHQQILEKNIDQLNKSNSRFTLNVDLRKRKVMKKQWQRIAKSLRLYRENNPPLGIYDADSSEYEEDLRNEEVRLRPWMVRRDGRKQEKEAEQIAIESRLNTLRIVEENVQMDIEKQKPVTTESSIDDICTDDEMMCKTFKVRELKRIVCDQEENHADKQKNLEIKRMRKLTN